MPEPFFKTRGVVLVVNDVMTLDWPARAHDVGLTTIALHIHPHEIAEFIQTDTGHHFLERCHALGIQVEYELHAMTDFLPRELFDKSPEMFRADEHGQRVREHNLCVHSAAALDFVCESAIRYTKLLRSTTGRYFYWPDDGQPMCRCANCRELSDSDQTLLLENRILKAIRTADRRAMLAHLVYTTSLAAPQKVKPSPGIFLEYAPISRAYDVPFRKRDVKPGPYPGHGELLDHLDANLKVFGRNGAQVLEYWLDLSRFAGWKREQVKKLPWNDPVFRDDLDLYAHRGLRHVTTFAAWLDGDYVRRFGEPPLAEYAHGLNRWTLRDGKPVEAR